MKIDRQQVIGEKYALDAKQEALRTFMRSKEFGQLPDDERVLLQWQIQAMQTYSNVLLYRISRM